MPYLVTSPLVLVKVPDQVGDGYRVDYHYRGDVVPWLSDEQAEHFLSEGLVREVGDSDDGEAQRPAKTATKPVLIRWLVNNAVDGDGNDYDADVLDKEYDKPGLWGLIDSVE